jgi:hypothetical protein
LREIVDNRPITHPPPRVEGDHRHERDLVEDLVQLVGGDAELLGDLGVGGAAVQAVLQAT